VNLRFTICDLRVARQWVAVLGGIVLSIVLCGQSAELVSNAPAPTTNASIVNRQSEIPTVGMEGRVEVVLPGTALEPKPFEHKGRLIVRIAETRPRGDSIWYDFRYTGLVPGNYDLRGYLQRPDGSTTNNLPPIPVRVAPLLPETHNGLLVEPRASPLGRLGGYTTLMIVTAVVWALLFIPLVWRHRKKAAPAVVAPPEPTFAQRLRPLVEQAAAGTLSGDGQAQLERMLLNYWRDRLALGTMDMAQAIGKLRDHPEAGELLRALESWLHRPAGSAAVDVAAVLKPYRNISTPPEPAAADSK
jgi:hypothetical protein